MVDYHKHIDTDPDVKMGKAVIKGTRVTVKSILERLAAGEDISELLEAFPHLEREDIQAALGYAAHVLRTDDVSPPPGEDA